jgi:hypothetical protein
VVLRFKVWFGTLAPACDVNVSDVG